MAGDQPPTSLSPADFAAIEGAVMETARGRRFLREFARRNRHADTETLLAALERLEALLAPGPPEARRPVADPAPPSPQPAGGPAVAAFADAWRTLLAAGGGDAAGMTDDAAALSLARRLGGFAQDARDLAGALKAAAAESAGPPAGALASMAELAQVVVARQLVVPDVDQHPRQGPALLAQPLLHHGPKLAVELLDGRGEEGQLRRQALKLL